MKLVLCTECHDVFKLDYLMRTCKCGLCRGKYLDDGLNAVYSGITAVPLGFANTSLIEATDNQPDEGMGEEFVAFVIPKACPTMERHDALFDDFPQEKPDARPDKHNLWKK